MYLDCLNCNEEINFYEYYHSGEIVECPHCKTKFKVEYDGYYDSETGEEDNWWWFLKVE